jgi:hypothetical protein
MQEKACAALRSLATFNAGNQVKIAGAVGIEAVVAAMDVHKIYGVLLQQACAALSNLALNNDHKQLKIAEAGGIEAVVAAMEAHKTTSSCRNTRVRRCGSSQRKAA